MNTISDLTESNTDSFQSISKLQKEQSDVLINHINNCPLCKMKFKSQLKKGRWKFQIIHHHMGYWVWEKGIQDSDRLTKFKKCQQFCLNFCGGISMMTTINV